MSKRLKIKGQGQQKAKREEKIERQEKVTVEVGNEEVESIFDGKYKELEVFHRGDFKLTL